MHYLIVNIEGRRSCYVHAFRLKREAIWAGKELQRQQPELDGTLTIVNKAAFEEFKDDPSGFGCYSGWRMAVGEETSVLTPKGAQRERLRKEKWEQRLTKSEAQLRIEELEAEKIRDEEEGMTPAQRRYARRKRDKERRARAKMLR